MRVLRKRAAAFARALGGFLRGFLGLAEIPADRAAARRELTERSARRRSCC